MLLTLYKSMVRPRLEYCIQAWSPYNKGDIRRLEQVQHRATRLVPELAGLSYEQRLTQLGLTTLEECRITGDMIETNKILRVFDKVGGEQFLQLAPRGQHLETRGHSLKLMKPHHRTTKRNNVFNARIVNKWNSLAEWVLKQCQYKCV